MQSKGLSRVFSNTKLESISSSTLSLLYGPTLIPVHDYWKDRRSCFGDIYSLHTTLPCPRLRCQCSCSRGAHTCSALQSRWTTSLCLNRLTSCLCTPYPLSLEYLSLLLPADSRPITKARLTHRIAFPLSHLCIIPVQLEMRAASAGSLQLCISLANK